MKINKFLVSIITASAFFVTSQQSVAVQKKHGECENTKITSSFITQVSEDNPAWIVNGDCMEQVTNVSLAKDGGDGFEDIPFTAEYNERSKISLIIPMVPRTSLSIGSIPLGQFLLQIKSCRNGDANSRCKILDEKYMITGFENIQ